MLGELLNKIFGKAYIKNLKDSQDRREYIKAQCNSINLDYELVEAIKGVDIDGIDEGFYIKHGGWEIPYPASAGFLGNQQTAINIINNAIDNNIEKFIGLDDDCIFEHTRNISSSAIKTLEDTLPENWDVVILGDIDGIDFNINTEISYSKCTIHQQAAGSHGLAIRETVYKEFKKSAETYWGDGVIGDLIDRGLNVYKISPSICKQNRLLFSDINLRFHH